MNFQLFGEPCINCGKITDIRNKGLCNKICEGEYETKILREEGTHSSVLSDQQDLPAWEDVKTGLQGTYIKNRRQAVLANQKARQEAKIRLHEDMRKQWSQQ